MTVLKGQDLADFVARTSRPCRPDDVYITFDQDHSRRMSDDERERLPDEKVRQIREALANKESSASIAKRFRISPESVSHIKLGKTYRGVK